MDSQPSGAGSSKKSTVYVAGLSPEVNEQQLLDAFVTFGKSPMLFYRVSLLTVVGDILEISLPAEANERKLHHLFIK